MRICYIVGAGDFSAPFTPKKDDMVIAADGGLDTLKKHGIKCDLLVGDLDSVKGEIFGVEILRHKVEKDETDMHLSLMAGANAGYKNFYIYGATGGRKDHTFANYCLLLWGKNRGYDVKIISEDYIISVIQNEEIKASGDEGATFSLFAFGSDAEGVSIKNAKYELENAKIKCEFPIGVSNSFKEGEVTISVKDGALLFMQKIRS